MSVRPLLGWYLGKEEKSGTQSIFMPLIFLPLRHRKGVATGNTRDSLSPKYLDQHVSNQPVWWLNVKHVSATSGTQLSILFYFLYNYIKLYIYIYIYTPTHTYSCILNLPDTHTHMHAHTHTHTRAHTHTHSCMLNLPGCRLKVKHVCDTHI